ncbi:hypothetical protein [Lutispora thermophila]|uniref:Uncharacterized protein n=1 Tax=Lutispora thermophila DSM 19022 TaxID=1122184 RepID=A0A1M6E7U5_9FIRM|nr:hypothetical protein [Lutispora thermophila]SHI81604.1 hypothetical protein SAMN02745176_01478 [Lutispora thermophila DSM 19022]
MEVGDSMEYKIEEILKDLVRIDNIASEMNEKRQIEVNVIEQKYKMEIENLKRQLEDEKANARRYIDDAIAEAQKEAERIEEEKLSALRNLERRYNEIKDEVLSQTIYKIFGMELGSKWMP